MKILRTELFGFLVLTLLLASCTANLPTSGTSSGGAGPLICEVYYRPESGQGLEAAPPITLEGSDQLGHQFEAMSFEAKYQDDPFEGQAFSIVIISLETEAEISRQLYQFDPENSPENQFVGGHGFTGLSYVFHPGSSAEMQYFCRVQES